MKMLQDAIWIFFHQKVFHVRLPLIEQQMQFTQFHVEMR